MKGVEVPVKNTNVRRRNMNPPDRIDYWPFLSDLIPHSSNQMRKTHRLAPTGLMKY